VYQVARRAHVVGHGGGFKPRGGRLLAGVFTVWVALLLEFAFHIAEQVQGGFIGWLRGCSGRVLGQDLEATWDPPGSLCRQLACFPVPAACRHSHQ
jgi:hypothetical protein